MARVTHYHDTNWRHPGFGTDLAAGTVSCGCCKTGCCCLNHMDIPRGRRPAICERHAVKVEAAHV